MSDLRPVPPSLEGHCFKPGQSGNPAGLPKNFRRITDATRQLLNGRGATPEETVSKFIASRGRDLRGADHAAIGWFLNACDQDARNGTAALKEILDRTEGPVARDVNLKQEAAITVNIVNLDDMLEGFVSPQTRLETEIEANRQRALMGGVLDAVVVDFDSMESPTADSVPDEGELP